MQDFLVPFEHYTSIQKRVLFRIGKTPRFGVVGGPGTGKTVLALEAVNRTLEKEAAEGVVFLVYSRPLSEFLSRHVRTSSEWDVVLTWHSWLIRWLKLSFGLDYGQVIERYQIQKYVYDWERIHQDVDAADYVHQYEYIFIDEGQDLPRELLTLLDKIAARLYVFFDDNQKFTPALLKTEPDITHIKRAEVFNALDIEEAFYDLTVNFRNTQAVERAAKLFEQPYFFNEVTLRRITAPKKGRDPRLLDVRDDQELTRHIIEESLKYPERSIGVLIPLFKNRQGRVRDHYESLFRQDARVTDDNFHAYHNRRDTMLNTTGIFLMTYQTAKGLEFDHVYLLALNAPDFTFDYYQRNAFYVSATRAKETLILVYDGSQKDSEVTRTAKRHDACFQHASWEGFDA